MGLEREECMAQGHHFRLSRRSLMDMYIYDYVHQIPQNPACSL